MEKKDNWWFTVKLLTVIIVSILFLSLLLENNRQLILACTGLILLGLYIIVKMLDEIRTRQTEVV